MPFTYLLGNPSAPRGHALLLLRSERGDPGVWATYLVVTPITMDFTKYLPPMFASFAAMAPQSAAAAVPMPPIPERLDSEVAVRRLAEARGDDLLDGGTVDTQAVDRLMLVTAEAAQRYHDAYVAYLRTVPETPAVVAQEVQSLSADELTAFQALTEGEQLSELSKLVGKLRYAVSGHDIYHAAEARRQITALASLLPPKYRIDDLLGAAQRDDATADRLTELYLERCFKILHEEYEQLPALEARIKELGE
ncbi:MAG: hypothetical protein M1296_03575 [Chloroflexi bacterium]|nr:hypothetical protein [Chloroflexota bacterium]